MTYVLLHMKFFSGKAEINFRLDAGVEAYLRCNFPVAYIISISAKWNLNGIIIGHHSHYQVEALFCCHTSSP